MDNLGNYLTVKQAKKFLSERIKYKVSKRDLFELAARGRIKLCVSFDGNVAEFKYNYPDPTREGAFVYKLKNALIKIPSEAINLKGGIVKIIPIEVIEVVINSDYKAAHPFYGGGCESLAKLGNGMFYGTYTHDPENLGKIKFSPFEANSDDVVIPKQDLLDFIESKNTEQPEPQVTKSAHIQPWLEPDPRDPKPEQSWYTPARYFARQLVKENSTLLTKKPLLAKKVAQSLSNVGIYKRGGKFPPSYGTILKAFRNVSLG